jgi:hypothetical protein
VQASQQRRGLPVVEKNSTSGSAVVREGRNKREGKKKEKGESVRREDTEGERMADIQLV